MPIFFWHPILTSANFMQNSVLPKNSRSTKHRLFYLPSMWPQKPSFSFSYYYSDPNNGDTKSKYFFPTNHKLLLSQIEMIGPLLGQRTRELNWLVKTVGHFPFIRFLSSMQFHIAGKYVGLHQPTLPNPGHYFFLSFPIQRSK